MNNLTVIGDEHIAHNLEKQHIRLLYERENSY